jgi:carboxymethylenebutenolidase
MIGGNRREGEGFMGQAITLTAKDGHKLDAYRADPVGNPRGAIVVIQEIFGVNQHMRRLTDDFAKAGYVAVSPALFDRVEKSIELGYDPKSIEAGREIRGKAALDGALFDLQAAIDYVKQFGRVGVVGYCWGGGLAFLSATRLQGVAGAVGYYGGLVAAHAQEKPKVPVILHFGQHDQSIPMTDVEKVKTARPEVPVHIYDAGHGFACDERASYNADATKVALDRTLKFFKKTVG